ncbi:MAG: MFS transporter [Conexivisphaera sp.]
MGRRSVLAAAASIAFMAYGIRYAYGVMMPEMERALGMSAAQAGLVYSSFLGAYVAASVIVGFLIDVHDLRRIVLAFLPLFALGTGMMGLASSPLEAALYFGIAGVGASVGWTPLVVWVQRAYPGRRGTFLGILQVGCNLGFGTLGLLVPAALPLIGWRGAWWTLGGAAAAWLIPITALARGASSPEGGSSSLRNYLRGFASVLGDRAFWIGGTSYFLASYAIMTPLSFSAGYAELLGSGPAGGGALFSLIGFVGIAGALGIPALSDRLGRRAALVINNSLMAIGLAGSALAGSYSALAAWTAAVGVSYGGVWVLYAALVRDLYEGRIAGGVMGAWTVLGGAGLMASPPLGGLMFDATGSYLLAYAVAAAAAALSIAALFALGDDRRAHL